MATTLISFDSGDTSGFALVDFGGTGSALETTPPTGASGQAIKVIKGAAGAPSEGWAGTTFLDLASGEFITPASHIVTMRVWSPDAGTVVRLKLEDKADPTHTIESDTTTTVAGGWQTLTFDMANAATNGGNPTAPLNDAFTFNRASIFFAFGSAGTGQTYYFDDVSYNAAPPTPTPAPSLAPVVSTVHVTFDSGDTSGYDLVDFGGAGSALETAPPTGGSGQAAKVVKSAGAAEWAGTTFLALGSSEMITTANKTMTMRVWSPDAGTVVRLKLEDTAAPSHSVEAEAITTVAGGWQTLNFNFANHATGTAAFNDAYNFNKASVFFAFGSGGSGKTYYFDDVAYAQPVAAQGHTVTGGANDDTLTPGFGNASVNGGAGTDTVILPMFPNVFSLAGSVGQVSGSYGTGTPYSLALNDVEWARFGTNFHTTIALSELVSGDAQLQLGRLTDLYLAFFGRAPDVSGLEYWQERLLEEGRDFATISKDFAWSTEAQALFPATGSNRDFVQTVYVNSFGRQPDAGGWDWWTAKLDGLGVTDLNDRGAFVGELILGAYATTSGEEDRSLLTHRHEAAMYYVNQLSIMPAEGFDTAINTLLTRVTGDASTQDKAQEVIDHVFANPITLTGMMADQVLLDSIWGA